MTTAKHAAVVALLAVPCVAFHAPASADEMQPKEILQKAFAAYSSAKSYQATWSYVTESGSQKQTATITVRSKSPSRLFFRVAQNQPPKPDAGDAIEEMQVVIDGTTAYFENVSTKMYFKVTLPKDAQVNPLMFFPQMRMAADPERAPDLKQGDTTYYVVQGARPDGSNARMEIDAATFHIHRMEADASIGNSKRVSTMSVDKETFDAVLADKDFAYKPPKGAKQIDPPVGVEAMFGTKPETK